jgi:hypothetical protein
MPYVVYRSDGIPLQEFDSLRVCRDGRFTKAYQPRVNDVFTIVTHDQAVSYCVHRVDGFKAFTTKACVEDRR